MLTAVLRRTAALLAAAAALGAAALSMAVADQADAARAKCSPPNSYDLQANGGHARVFEHNGKAYVCVKRTGRTTLLQGAVASEDTFAVAGRYVAWSSDADHDRLRVMHIPTRRTTFDWTSDQIVKIALKRNGAVAWAASPMDVPVYVMGTERRNHSPSTLSDDQLAVDGSTLRVAGGRAVWRYSDGTSGSGRLF